MPSIPSSKPSPPSTRLASSLCTAHKATIPSEASRHHEHFTAANQCCSVIIQQIPAPVSSVWSVLRRFDRPQSYKRFIKSCHVIRGSGGVGTLREVHVISGLPASSSHERLEILDEEKHVLSFRVVGGEHRLKNYKSVTTVHPQVDGTTVVVESYVVDVPPGNTKEDTKIFVDTIVKCNLQSLARIAGEVYRKGSGTAGM
ncbi:Abscisic acid receptor PYR1 [Rhynchospora pubera]|uniref:Abscisic acid receptor PYR1 n=1 Tax=Rhynchospora pubera TaxID=906938 RepID=A0AAV8EGD2_9POAL|nr:Abscisic acid receptor PYR1 [Rhynchospora pubera]KAJ4786101.1 Abscisic acid receptor PYR1 [Rhynchospora pubera]